MVGLRELFLMDNLKDFILVSIPVLSLIVSIIAICAGYKRALKVAQIQIDSAVRLNVRQIISPMRQVWIDSLRQKTSEFLNLSDRLYNFLHENNNVREFYKTHEWEFVPPDADRKIDLLYYDIVLMLNDKEEDHSKFIELLHNCRKNVFNKNLSRPEFYETHHEILRLCKSILKREWKRVKTDE